MRGWRGLVRVWKHYLDVINARHGGAGRPFMDKVISILDEGWDERNVFIVEAPTGYGKTDISLTVAKYSVEEELKAVIAYPLRTLLEQQVGVFEELFRECGLGKNLIGKRYMMHPESLYFVKPVTLTTVDTLALTMLGVAPEDLSKVLSSLIGEGRGWGSMGHYVFSWASAFTSNIVVDEAHLLADSGKALAFISFLAREAILHDQHLIIMTATMPPQLPKLIKEVAGGHGERKVRVISFEDHLRGVESGGVSDDFIIGRAGKEYVVETKPVSGGADGGVKEAVEWVAKACEDRDVKPPRVLAVFNTVGEAVEAYRLALRELPIEPERVLLLHSRFTAADREALARKLGTITEGVRRGEDTKPYAVIATQAVEAGVDITSNIFATDAAPPTTVVQRAGRFLRYGERRGRALLWWEGSEESVKPGKSGLYKVYDPRLVEATIKWVRSHEGKVNLHLPRVPQGLPDITPKPGYGSVLSDAYSHILNALRGRELRLISRMEDIVTDYMKGSRRAAELLTELGGSFIRDSTLAPVIPEGLAGRDGGSGGLMRYVIPATPSTLLRLHKAGKVVGVVTDAGLIKPLPQHVKEQLNKALRYWGNGRAWGVAAALRCITKVTACLGVNAFVVRAEYDSREGLKA